MSVIIDRQNFDKQQRSHWIQVRDMSARSTASVDMSARQIARAAGVEVVAAILTTPYDVRTLHDVLRRLVDTSGQECQRRLQVRTDHETIASPGVALDLLDRFSMSWRPPTANEVRAASPGRYRTGPTAIPGFRPHRPFALEPAPHL